LKSNISRELSFFLYTSTRALSILVLTPALNGLYAAGVGSLSASFRRLFDNLFLVQPKELLFKNFFLHRFPTESFTAILDSIGGYDTAEGNFKKLMHP
jgi:hypothetical protein